MHMTKTTTQTRRNHDRDRAAACGGIASGAVYSYGAVNSTDRALGSLASGSVSPMYGAVFVNNTANTYTAFTVSFTGEQWRRGTGAANAATFSYAVGAANIG